MDSNEPQDDLAPLLGEHFRQALDGQRGKAAKAFKAFIARPMILSYAQAPHGRRWRLAIAGVGVALAASIVVVFAGSIFKPRVMRVSGSGTIGITATPPNPLLADYEQNVLSDLKDEGTVILRDGTPARQVHRYVLEQTRYYDAVHQAYVQTTVPHEQVFLVGVDWY